MAHKKAKKYADKEAFSSGYFQKVRPEKVPVLGSEEYAHLRKKAGRLYIDDDQSGVREPEYSLTCMYPEHQHRFELFEAGSEAEKQTTFRIRHAAYCGEGNPLPAQPDGLERDIYDEEAIHVLARLDGVSIGTVRTTYMCNDRFVIETFVEDGEPVIKIPPELPRHLMAEPSRLAIDKSLIPTCVYSPLLSVALHHRNYIAGVRAGLKYWVMEPNQKNLRIIRRLGWKTHSLGEFEHHGQQFEASWILLEPSSFSWQLNS